MLSGVRLVLGQIYAVVKVFFLLGLSFVVPKIIIHHAHSSQHIAACTVQQRPFLGVENISHRFLRVLAPSSGKKMRVGLVVNEYSVDQSGRRTQDILLDKGVDIRAVFIPDAGNQEEVWRETVRRDGKTLTNIPMVSLYSPDGTQKIKAPSLENIDVFVVDVQDSGVRHNCSVSVLLDIMRFAHHYKKRVIVLDRPNFLGGIVEGGILSSVAHTSQPLPPVPVRHGMTMGELARYFNRYVLARPVKLFVIPLVDYERNSVATVPFVNPSKNITTVNAAQCYSFLGLLGEVRPFDVGIGTEYAFEALLLPESYHISQNTWQKLGRLLCKKHGIKGRWIKGVQGKKKGVYSGLMVASRSVTQLSSLRVLVDILLFFKQQGVQLRFSSFFDRALGTSKVRECIEGKIPVEYLWQLFEVSTDYFIKRASYACIYRPFPEVKAV